MTFAGAATFLGLAADAWTALGTWATALLALVAVALTGGTLRRDRERLAQLERREQDSVRRERRSQASGIYFAEPQMLATHGALTDGYRAVLYNASDRPVYHVFVIFRQVLEDIDPKSGALNTGDEIVAAPSPARIGPGCDLTFSVGQAPSWSRYEAVARFRDAAGVSWRLNSFGHLDEPVA